MSLTIVLFTISALTTPAPTEPPSGSSPPTTPGESGEGSGESGEGSGESGEGSGESGDWESSGIGSGEDDDELVRELIFLNHR